MQLWDCVEGGSTNWLLRWLQNVPWIGVPGGRAELKWTSINWLSMQSAFVFAMCCSLFTLQCFSPHNPFFCGKMHHYMSGCCVCVLYNVVFFFSRPIIRGSAFSDKHDYYLWPKQPVSFSLSSLRYYLWVKDYNKKLLLKNWWVGGWRWGAKLSCMSYVKH